MTYCKTAKSALSGTITCPPSKSYTHRAIFLASIAHKKGSTITNMLRSADTDASINACKRFGATFEINDDIMHVTNVIPIHHNSAKQNSATNDAKSHVDDNANKKHDAIVIDAANSGTTIRVAASIASLLDNTCVTLTGDKSLKTRPMQPLLDALSKMGAVCRSLLNNGRPPLEICGPPISGGDISIHGDVSSQFITSLFLCAPRTDSGINITITGNTVSKPYLDATISIMREFGISVNTQIPYKKYNVTSQKISPVTNFTVPFDASSLALLLAASALNKGDITIKAQMGTLPQGDEVFIDMLESMGARIEITDSVTSQHNDKDTKNISNETIQVISNNDNMLMGGRFDLSNSPDLLPPLSIMALKCKKPIEIYNVVHARLKETDRIAILARELPKVGIKVTECKDGMILDGQCKSATTWQKDNTATILNSENDHRIFMALCIAGLYVGNCKVSDPDSVAVSYPRFIKDMKALGAKITTQ